MESAFMAKRKLVEGEQPATKSRADIARSAAEDRVFTKLLDSVSSAALQGHRHVVCESVSQRNWDGIEKRLVADGFVATRSEFGVVEISW